MARPIPRNGEPAPDGFHYVAVRDTNWRLAEDCKRCRGGAGHQKPACGAPAVAELLRSRYRAAAGRWWAYCPDHMYGRWVENGLVMHWIVQADAAEKVQS